MGHLHETEFETVEHRHSAQFIGVICQQKHPDRAPEMD